MLTNLLTGAIDMTMRDALNWDGVLAARDQWEAQGQGRVLLAPVQEDAATPSLNPWLADVRVRQALLHAIDREEIKQALSGGLIDTAHILLAPQHPAFEGALGAAQKYGFDVQRAQTLLQQAGWTRGTDGVLVNQRGEHFSME